MSGNGSPDTDRGVHRLLLVARGIRGLGDGLMGITIPAYLAVLGFSPLQIGVIITATVLSASLLSLVAALSVARFGSRLLFGLASLAIMVSGVALASFESYLPLLGVALLGALNLSNNDINTLAPLEQARLAEAARGGRRVTMFSAYTLIGSLGMALGGLAAALPQWAAGQFGLSLAEALKGGFIVYGLLGVSLLVIYLRLPRDRPAKVRRPGLHRSRRTVSALAATFALDAFGGGFAIQSILTLWLFGRFGASLADVAAILFAAGLAASASLLLAPWLSRRIGLLNTMVYTQASANVALLLVPFMPTLETAVGMLVLRSLLSHMDVPARLAFIMAAVDPHERAAAASITSVARGLAGAGSPVLAGSLLALSSFGWPLLIGGGLKLVYAALFVMMFRKLQIPDDG